MKSIVVSGKNIEKAIEEGLLLLNTTFENVDIKVISEGGFLKKATVELTISEDVEKEKQQKIEKLEKQEAQKSVKEKSKPQPIVEKEVKPLEAEDLELVTKLQSIEQELQEIQETTNPKPEKVDNEKLADEEIKKFLNGLLYAYNMMAQVETSYVDREFKVNIVGENLGVLIGYHGEALEAIQYVLSNYIYNKTGRNYRILLDIENYRQKRADSLKGMATSLAQKVVETKRSFKLEPMNSFERKTIHSHLQEMENVATHSEGVEPHRYLVIDYVENNV